MAKFYGNIGFGSTVETRKGVWEPSITELSYSGDILSNNWRRQSTEHINDDITISNEISIIADPYANENFSSMKYVVYMGIKWKITNVSVQFPRLILTLGGVYNEQNG